MPGYLFEGLSPPKLLCAIPCYGHLLVERSELFSMCFLSGSVFIWLSSYLAQFLSGSVGSSKSTHVTLKGVVLNMSFQLKQKVDLALEYSF